MSASFALHIKKWRAAHAVATAGSTSRAAELLHLSQPAIARAVRGLEAALDLALFERVAHGMLPTAPGEILLARAARAFEQIALAENAVAALGSGGARLRASSQPRLRLAAASHRQLQALIVLHEKGSETAAAHAMGVSQPAVNQAVRQLEHLAGSRLFLRVSGRMRLTEAGEIVLRRVKLALAEFRLAEEDLAQHFGRVKGRVVIGSLPLSSGLLVPRAVERVLARHPDLLVTIVDGTYDTLLHDLRHADIDVIVGALREPAPAADVAQQAIFDDTLSVVVRSGHPLAAAAPRDFAGVVGCDWIVPLPGTPAREAFERAFRADGLVAPVGHVQANSAPVVRALLLESDRLALLSPRQVFREVRAGLLTVLPIAVRDTHRQIGFTTRAGDRPSAGVQSLLAELRHCAYN